LSVVVVVGPSHPAPLAVVGVLPPLPVEAVEPPPLLAAADIVGSAQAVAVGHDAGASWRPSGEAPATATANNPAQATASMAGTR
jgi:hypothetical protein